MCAYVRISLSLHLVIYQSLHDITEFETCELDGLRLQSLTRDHSCTVDEEKIAVARLSSDPR